MRSLCLLLALCPSHGLAEGAEQVWDCRTTALCPDAAGQEDDCTETGSVPELFRIAPLKTDADGRGQYRVGHNGASFDGEGQGYTGAFEWVEGDGLVHVLRADAGPDGSPVFDLVVAPTDGSTMTTRTLLDCEVTQ